MSIAIYMHYIGAQIAFCMYGIILHKTRNVLLATTSAPSLPIDCEVDRGYFCVSWEEGSLDFVK